MANTSIQKDSSQQAVINCINGPVLVIACPGAGKTTTLLLRIHKMIEEGIPEENILMVTFTKNAAAEMKNRYMEQYGSDCNVTFKTIHALCYMILNEAGLYDAADIISEWDVNDFIYEQLSHGSTYIEDSYDLVDNIVNEISSIKNNYTSLKNYEAISCDTEIFLQIYKNYQNMLKETHRIDYDEMMLETEKLLKRNKKILKKYQEQFKYIQCDEYQDTNPVQKNILYLLTSDNKNFCAVGDDDQSIYGFRGAIPEIMFDFQKDFPECQTFYISTNYRSGQNIVDVAGSLISMNQKRFEKDFISFRGKKGFKGEYVNKEFDTKAEEMQYLAKRIASLHKKGIDYKDIAVLFRTNALAKNPLEALSAAEIPFRSNEKVQSIYNGWLFNLICSYLNLSIGKWKQQYINDIISKPNKYIKVGAFKDCPYDEFEMRARLSYMEEEGKPYWQIKKAKDKISDIFTAFSPGKYSKDSKALTVIKSLEYLGIEETILERARKRHEDAETGMAELEALKEDAKKCKTIGAWMKYANADRQRVKKLNRKRNQVDGVNVMTMHSAKGCEWKCVFVIDVNQNIIPHRKSIIAGGDTEEELRLLYVAMTRAKDKLYVLSSGIPSIYMQRLDDIRAEKYSKVHQK